MITDTTAELLALRQKYPDEKHIETLQKGMRGFGEFKFRVLSREGYPTHHTDDIRDAREWLDKCRISWENSQEDA